MSVNATTCSNCGTENPPGTDECIKCGMPLTASAGQELRAELEAQDDAGLLGPRDDVTPLGPLGPLYTPYEPRDRH